MRSNERTRCLRPRKVRVLRRPQHLCCILSLLRICSHRVAPFFLIASFDTDDLEGSHSPISTRFRISSRCELPHRRNEVVPASKEYQSSAPALRSPFWGVFLPRENVIVMGSKVEPEQAEVLVPKRSKAAASGRTPHKQSLSIKLLMVSSPLEVVLIRSGRLENGWRALRRRLLEPGFWSPWG